MVSKKTKKWEGYNDWTQSYEIEEEIALVKYTIQKAKDTPNYRGHIRGISLAESVELLRRYYQEQ